jgi:CDP-glycerol glycerophosphotransferase (TagB/SpsB family)
MLWVLLRVKIIIDSGNNFFNPLGILNQKSVTKISTSHGNGPKVTVSRFHPPDNYYIAVQQITNLYKFNYVNYPSDFSVKEIGQKTHLLPDQKIINLGYPRCDIYFNKDTVKEKYEKKILSRSISSEINKDSKIILYTPTWRPYEYEFPLFKMDKFNLCDLDEWLKKKNSFLFFSIHTAQEPKNIPDSLTNIINIDSNLPFYDTNEFMMEVDILLNDYSTTSTDFALLSRPQLFYMPDYEKYEKESGFIEEYKKTIPGKEIFTYQDLISNLEYIFANKYDYLQNYEDIRVNLLKKYYECSNGDSSERFYIFIKKILKN